MWPVVVGGSLLKLGRGVDPQNRCVLLFPFECLSLALLLLFSLLPPLSPPILLVDVQSSARWQTSPLQNALHRQSSRHPSTMLQALHPSSTFSSRSVAVPSQIPLSMPQHISPNLNTYSPLPAIPWQTASPITAAAPTPSPRPRTSRILHVLGQLRQPTQWTPTR